MSNKRCDDQYFRQPLYQFAQLLAKAFARNVGTGEAGGTHEPPSFLADQLTYLNQGSGLCPPHYYSALPDFQTFQHSCLLSLGYISQHLEPNLHGLAERASVAASYLHLPSKSHRGIAKIFAQVNSLQKNIVKNVIRTQKEFFSYCSYVYTNRA